MRIILLWIHCKIQWWLGITQIGAQVSDGLLELREEIADLRTEFESRLAELEKSYAQGSIKQSKEEPVEPIVRGHVPLSVRRRQFEQAHRKQIPPKQGTS
jgi:hypothetical protein